MRRVLIACVALCICISPAMAGPKEGPKEGQKAGHKCETCADIKKTGEGWCDKCKTGMVAHLEVKNAKLYKEMKDSAYEKAYLAGSVKKVEDIKCADCKKMAEAHKDGYCKKCEGGMVAGRCFKGKEAYDKAEHAFKVLKEAAKAKCDTCALAIVSDGKCDHCKVGYKDGKKTKI